MSDKENEKQVITYFSESHKKELIFRITIAIFSISFVIAYVVNFHYGINFFDIWSNKQEDWGTLGDYIGGTVGTVIAFAVFIATLEIIHLQRKAFNTQKEELKATENELKNSRIAQELQAELFKQQQFETTFFNMLNLLHKYQKLGVKNTDDGQLFEGYPLILVPILDHMKDYSDVSKYLNILKANLNCNNFLFIIQIYVSSFISNKYQEYYPYPQLKKMIEDYSLFDFIPKMELEAQFGKPAKHGGQIRNKEKNRTDYQQFSNILNHLHLAIIITY